MAGKEIIISNSKKMQAFSKLLWARYFRHSLPTNADLMKLKITKSLRLKKYLKVFDRDWSVEIARSILADTQEYILTRPHSVGVHKTKQRYSPSLRQVAAILI